MLQAFPPEYAGDADRIPGAITLFCAADLYHERAGCDLIFHGFALNLDDRMGRRADTALLQTLRSILTGKVKPQMRLRRAVPLLSSFNEYQHQDSCVRRLSWRDGSNAALSDNAGHRVTCSLKTQGLGFDAGGNISASLGHGARCRDQRLLLFPSRLGRQNRFKRWFKYAPSATHAPHHPTKEWVDKISAMHLPLRESFATRAATSPS
jgi:hypothetical protein